MEITIWLHKLACIDLVYLEKIGLDLLFLRFSILLALFKDTKIQVFCFLEGTYPQLLDQHLLTYGILVQGFI